MIVSIHQPNYLPWLGFFDKLIRSDVLVILDNVQFPRGKTFISRAAIKTPQGPQWLSVPVLGKSELTNISEVKIAANQPWSRKHLKALTANYGRSPYYDLYYPQLLACYQEQSVNLAELNTRLIAVLAGFLGARTKLVRASEFMLKPTGGESELGLAMNKRELGLPTVEGPLGLVRILDICLASGASKYLTGQGTGTQRYMEETAFQELGIQVIYQNYIHPVYSQLWGEFLPNLSVLDLLFNHGPEARGILLSS